MSFRVMGGGGRHQPELKLIAKGSFGFEFVAVGLKLQSLSSLGHPWNGGRHGTINQR